MKIQMLEIKSTAMKELLAQAKMTYQNKKLDILSKLESTVKSMSFDLMYTLLDAITCVGS